MTSMKRRLGFSIVVVAAATLTIAGCSSTSSTPNSAQNAVAAANAMIKVSQDGVVDPGNDPKVYTPFFLQGTNFVPNTAVTISIVDKSNKPVATIEDTGTAQGTTNTQVATSLPAGQYTATSTQPGTTDSASRKFTVVAAARKPGLTRVTAAKGQPGAMASPTVANGSVYVAQAASGGAVVGWMQSALPKDGSAPEVTVASASTWVPKMPGGVVMKQVSVDNSGANILISKKAKNANTTGGNSTWLYPFGGAEAGTNLLGNPAPAGNGYYLWGPGAPATQGTPHNTAEGANSYTDKAFPTDQPTTVGVGDGGGVVQAKNNWYYFSSLQSGCVYKQNPEKTWADTVYCLPSWGLGNNNYSSYQLAEDGVGNVYATYYGSAGVNTIVLKITPSGNTNADTVGAIQLAGWTRTAGLASNAAGTKFFLNGVPAANYNDFNTNTILQVNLQRWGTPDKPTQVTPAARTTAPSGAWLVGTWYDEANNIVYVADNGGGFWMNYL